MHNLSTQLSYYLSRNMQEVEGRMITLAYVRDAMTLFISQFSQGESDDRILEDAREKISKMFPLAFESPQCKVRNCTSHSPAENSGQEEFTVCRIVVICLDTSQHACWPLKQ